ncbi:MAG: nucleotidyltransferase domain-containing protein [Archaeoglobaceae archaeon]|nr:nucleotidyltransferase domain-containing protein [Archaeoglobaceae archaeon]MCX8152294.1 nucleotidyltransferase domain-containing protein [Archaeoglobaceae archaeon]MDW8013972.1 nucleotidyltransferase domain-containing protein [Archaeoglobaceae archaeon]
MQKPIRLRDFVRVKDLYFSVIGYKNHEKVKCFLRYAPGDGDRIKDGKKFKKLSNEEVKGFKEFYDGKIFRIPIEKIDEVFKPEEKLREVMDDELKKVFSFFEKTVPEDKMGVTGSRLIGLRGKDSDIDFIVYGKYWFLAREKIRKGIELGKISEPDEETWNFIYKKRKVPLPYDIFVLHEKRKNHRAFIGSTYFDLLYVRDYDELSRDIPEDPGTKIGFREVLAEVLDSSFAFDYPSYYLLKSSDIKAVLSFTHSYAGQAFSGEKIYARGVVEIIDGEKYLVVGTSRETQEEFIVSVDLLEKFNLYDEFLKWLRERHP